MNKFLSPLPYRQQEGLGIIRIIVGLLMVYHGFELFDAATMQGYTTWAQFTSMPSPALIIYTGKGSELITGTLFVIGCFTRPAALLLIVTMLYISFFVGHGKVWYDDQHPFLFVLLGFVFFFSGPGKWSVDELLNKKRK